MRAAKRVPVDIDALDRAAQYHSVSRSAVRAPQ
jgi:hypothetical protein